MPRHTIVDTLWSYVAMHENALADIVMVSLVFIVETNLLLKFVEGFHSGLGTLLVSRCRTRADSL